MTKPISPVTVPNFLQAKSDGRKLAVLTAYDFLWAGLFDQAGVDAILVVKATAGYDGSPDNATVKLVSLKDGKLIVGANWQNGHGGMRGSPMDRNSRSGLVEAASQIASVVEQAIK